MDLSSNLHQLPAKVILIQMIGFSKKKKKEKKIIMNKSSSLLLHLHLHLLHFLIMNKSSNLKKRKKKRFPYLSKKKKREREEKKIENFQKASGLGALGSYFLSYHQKKNHQSKFSIPSKKFSKKK